MEKKHKKSETRTTSEKPVSLSPLKFKEALAGLLKVRPEKEENEKDEEIAGEEESSKES